MMQRFWGSWVFFVLVGIVAASSLDARSHGPLAERRAATAAPEAADKEAAPMALRAAYVVNVQKDAEPEYHIERAAGGLWARTHAQGLVAEFASTGVQLGPAAAEGEWALEIAATAWGCEGALTAVEPAEPEAEGNRVDYRREGLEEWYVNGPLGLEQGFTLPAPPACRGKGGQGVVIALGGGGDLFAEVSELGDSAVLRDASGKEVLRYADLYVVDATGRQLPGRLEGGAEGLSIQVDDRDGVYPIKVDPLWTEQQKLTASGVKTGDRFGHSVAVSGGTAIVGAHGTASTKGAAYVFDRSGNTWLQQQLLGSVTRVNFGFSVAISGDTAVVGAHGTKSNQGEAYVFVRSSNAWLQQPPLTASDALNNDEFGVSVAVSRGIVVVGARNKTSGQGAAYVFVPSGNAWTQEKLTASDGAPNDQFGFSVALDGDTAVVGARNKASAQGPGQGAAYVFAHSNNTWTQEKLTASDGAPNDQFGFSVAVSGDTAIVGAPANTSSPGAAYVFVRSSNSWIEQQKLTASDAEANAQFGSSVALSGSTAIVGAPVSANRQGAAYVFVRAGTSWLPKQKLTASNHADKDEFGVSVAVSGDTAVVGAHGKTAFTGTAYVFVNPGNPCSTATECLSGYCVNGFCCNAACGGGDPNSCQVCSKAQGASDDGTCTPLTGTVCDDGDTTTGDDVCTSGSCAGVNNCLTVTCPPPGVCHKTGSCIPPGGTCSDPLEDDGTPCDDGNPDTGDDVCTSGSCAGVNNCLTVTCPPPGVCHKTGSCIPPGGTCSDPLEDDGTPCDDGDPTTGGDKCQSGVCTGIDNCLSVTCTPLNACHETGSCDPLKGECSNPNKADGTECDDDDPKTGDGVCVSGVCINLCQSDICLPTGPCQEAGSCDPLVGTCSPPNKVDGAACKDPKNGDGVCMNGVCTNPCSNVTCPPHGPCQQEGKCNPLSSPYCSYPPVEDGTECNDQNACTQRDTCQTGECKGIENPCKASVSGQPDGKCDPTTGACFFPDKACDPQVDTCPPPLVSIELTKCQSDDDCKDQEGHGRCSEEGVCCDETCGDRCKSCLVPGFKGVCHEEQYTDLKQECGLKGSCDKTCYGGDCIEYTGKRQCAPNECTDTSHGIQDAYCYATEKECPTEQRAPFDCGRFACDPVQGACLQRCDTVKDCAPPFVCNLKNRCVDAPDVAVGTDRACAFAPAWPAFSGVRGALAALALAALSIARRRRRRTSGAWMFLVPLVLGAACDLDAGSHRSPSERPMEMTAPPAAGEAADAIEVDPLWIRQPERTASAAAGGAGQVLILALSDGEACSKADECMSGFCVDDVCCDVACGGGIKDDCQACSEAQGASADGVCTVLTGTLCDDKCLNAPPCAPLDECHEEGKCNPLNGACSYAPKPDRTPCDDGNRCTRGDTCQMGECKAIAETCSAPDMCHKDGECDPKTGKCTYPVQLCTVLIADAGPPPVVSGKLKNCTSDDDCKDRQGQGHCSEEHVCCDALCDGRCSSCRIPEHEGTCTSELHMDLKHDCGPKGYCLKTCAEGACVEFTGKRLCASIECTDTTNVAGEAYCEGTMTECPFEQRTLFQCDPNACDEIQGACLKECATVKDCAPPLVCNPDGECVQAPDVAVGADRACAFAPASPAGGGARGALAALALAALLVVRRRRAP